MTRSAPHLPGCNPADVATLQDILHGTRGIFEKVLSSSMSTSDTTGSCLYASVLVAKSVEKWTPFSAVVRGGGPLEGPALGYYDGSAWQGHYWVEVQLQDEPVAVVDITADQFGGPPVQVLAWAHASDRYRAGEQAAVDEAVQDTCL